MNEYSNLLMKKYFEENSMINADIKSFNYFIDVELQKIIEENKIIEPTIIPSNVEEYKIMFDNISIAKPEITDNELDGEAPSKKTMDFDPDKVRVQITPKGRRAEPRDKDSTPRQKRDK